MHNNDTIRILIGCSSQAALETCLGQFRDTDAIVRAHRVASLQDLADALRDRQWDLLIVDDDHPELQPADALGVLAASGSDIPCLIRTADPCSTDALAWRRAGASDVLPMAAGELLPLVVKRAVLALRTARNLAELQVKFAEIEHRCELLLDAAREAIAYIVDGMHVHANPRYAALFGYDTVDDLAPVPLIDLIDGAGQQEFKEALKRYRAAPDEDTSISFSGCRADGTRFDGELTLSTASYEGERCMQVVVHEYAREAVPMAAAPGAGNGLQETIDALRRHDGGQLVLLGIDAFLQHRRKLGASGVDQLVREIGSFVTRSTGWEPPPTRAADDVLAWCLAAEDADLLAAQAREMLGVLAHHIHDIGTQSVSCTISLSICPVETSVEGDAVETLDRALSALDEMLERSSSLRASDPARIGIIHGTDEASAPATSTIARPVLEEALRKGELRLLFQPIVSLRGDSNEYYEVFVRHQPSGASAHEWLAEHYPGDNGLELDRLFLHQALQMLARHQANFPQTRLILPIGAGSILDAGFVPWLGETLQALQLPPELITVGMDHQSAGANLKQAKTLAGQLGELGCRLCITEVHSGANPMPDLAHLQPQLVRVANVLSRVLDDGESRNTLLKPLIEALHREQIASIIPNVDSASALAILWQLGVSFIQGTYLQPAQPQMSYEFTDLN